MDTPQHIYQHTCKKCDRPALTFDEQDQPLCGRHATIFVGVRRAEIKADDTVDLDIDPSS
jgi:hypothetical protein